MEYGVVIVPVAELVSGRKEQDRTGRSDEMLQGRMDEMFSDRIDEVLSGWAVGILDYLKKGAIRVVTHYGYTGILRQDQVMPISEMALKWKQNRQRMVICQHVDVMNVPSVKGKILETLYQGSFVTVLMEQREENGYVKITTAGKKMGYLPAVFIGKRWDSDSYLLEKGCDPNRAWERREKFLTQEEEQEIRRRIIANARTYLGSQYRWGGKTADGIDCSGFVFMSYFMEGILLYRDAKIMPGYPVREISWQDVQPGDLMYWTDHVALYLGEGRYLHSTGARGSHGCVQNSLNGSDKIYRADLAKKEWKTGSVFHRMTV